MRAGFAFVALLRAGATEPTAFLGTAGFFVADLRGGGLLPAGVLAMRANLPGAWLGVEPYAGFSPGRD